MRKKIIFLFNFYFLLLVSALQAKTLANDLNLKENNLKNTQFNINHSIDSNLIEHSLKNYLLEYKNKINKNTLAIPQKRGHFWKKNAASNSKKIEDILTRSTGDLFQKYERKRGHFW